MDLALIGNGGVSALVDVRGDIVWSCVPRFDGEPIFHALLGSPSGQVDDGRFGVRLENFARAEQAYEPGAGHCIQ